MSLGPQILNQKYERAVFLGSKEFGLNIFRSVFSITPNLKWVIIHPDDSNDERSNLSDFAEFAKKWGVELLIPHSSIEAGEILSKVNPDIGIMCGWYWLLGPEQLASIHGGLWGIHNSLLPKYRGGSPLIWTILNGERYVGSTMFKLSEGLDDGPILHQICFEIANDEDVSTILLKIQKRMIDEVPNRWLELISNRAKFTLQDENQATYCGQRIADDGLIDWTKNAQSLHNFIRAQAPPYPGAFSFLLDVKVEFLKSKPLNEVYYGTPGQILRRTAKSIVISCGDDTAIEVSQLRVNGSISIPNEVVKSHRLRFSNTSR